MEPTPLDARPTDKALPVWVWESAAVLISIVGLLVRLIPWRWVFSKQPLAIPGPDPYYHIWRAEMLVTHFPHFPAYDPFVLFPDGCPIPWPPGFDLLLALPRLLGITQAPQTLATSSIMMPFLGALAIYLTYRLGRLIHGVGSGLVAAGFLALMHAGYSFSFVGRVDHHALVAPLTLGMYLAALACMTSSDRGKRIAWGQLAGLLAAAALACWIVTPSLYFVPVVATLFLMRWSPTPGPYRQAALAMLPSTAGLVMLIVVLTADLENRPFAMYQNSWFIVVPYVVAGVCVITALHAKRPILMTAVAAVASFLVVLFWAPGWFDTLLGVFAVVTGTDTSFSLVRESQSLLFGQGMFSLRAAIEQYTYLFLLTPILVPLYWVCTQRHQALGVKHTFLGIYVVMSVTSVLLQERFGEWAAPGVALLFGWIITRGVSAFVDFSKSCPSRVRAGSYAALLFLAGTLALSPLATTLIAFAKTDHVAHMRDLVQFGRQLQEHLPPALDQQGKPAYGIITTWGHSHPILYATRRPIAVSPFGIKESLEADRRAFRLLLSKDETSVFRQLKQLRLRYIITSPILSQANQMARIADMNQHFVTETFTHSEHGLFHHLSPQAPFFESIHTRLYIADGSGQIGPNLTSPALSHFRLILESTAKSALFNMNLARYKAFEAVLGATLEGKAAAGQTVRLSLALRSNTDRQFEYVRQTRADAQGNFTIRVPYASLPRHTQGQVGARSAYRVEIGQQQHAVEVTQQDIYAGSKIVVVPNTQSSP